jgi:hypothetical protein
VRVIWSLLGAVIGLVLADGLTFLIANEMFAYGYLSSFEGSDAMGVMFVWMPAAAILGAIGGAAVALHLTRRKEGGAP